MASKAVDKRSIYLNFLAAFHRLALKLDSGVRHGDEVRPITSLSGDEFIEFVTSVSVALEEIWIAGSGEVANIARDLFTCRVEAYTNGSKAGYKDQLGKLHDALRNEMWKDLNKFDQ